MIGPLFDITRYFLVGGSTGGRCTKDSKRLNSNFPALFMQSKSKRSSIQDNKLIPRKKRIPELDILSNYKLGVV